VHYIGFLEGARSESPEPSITHRPPIECLFSCTSDHATGGDRHKYIETTQSVHFGLGPVAILYTTPVGGPRRRLVSFQSSTNSLRERRFLS